MRASERVFAITWTLFAITTLSLEALSNLLIIISISTMIVHKLTRFPHTLLLGPQLSHIANKSSVMNSIVARSISHDIEESRMDMTREIGGKSQNEQASSKVTVTFSKPDGKRSTVKVEEGKSLYDAVIDNNVDIDGFGACEGTLCCTTCHLIFKQSDYEKVGEPSDEELDMLDLAYGLTDTSRLGCQVILKKNLDPLDVQVPASINDIRES